jgi:hypothetical protein
MLIHFIFMFRPYPQQLATNDDKVLDPALNLVNTIPKSTLNILLDSLLESSEKQLSTADQEQSTTVNMNEQLTADNLGSDIIDLEDQIKNQTESSENASESLPTETIVKESTIADNVLVSPGPIEVAEASSPGHVTLQSFLAAISQSREEENPHKEPVPEGPVILPFRTTLRTTTIATTTSTTPTTTTTGKLWFSFLIYQITKHMDF